MKKSLLSLLVSACWVAGNAWADASTPLALKIGGIEEGKPIPEKFAYCKPDGKGRFEDGGNINPDISWSGAPPDTKSFAIIVVDKDVPASFDLANRSGKIIPNDFPRRDFYHWVLVDIPPNITHIPEGAVSNGVILGGKPADRTAFGTNGSNDYAAAYGGSYGGYDGPCPPWNDFRLHHYHFMVYALNIPSLGMKEKFTGADAATVIIQHTLAQGEVTATYTDKAPTPATPAKAPAAATPVPAKKP